MKKLNLLQRLATYCKELIATVGFNMFLWASNLTEEEYWKQIYEQERAYYDSLTNKYPT